VQNKQWQQIAIRNSTARAKQFIEGEKVYIYAKYLELVTGRKDC